MFKVKESTVRRRYSDFEWLRNELERDSKVKMTIKKEMTVDFTEFSSHRLSFHPYLEKHGSDKCPSGQTMAYSMKIS